MDHKNLLSSEEVCAILEASAKAGVTVLKFGGLYARFGTTPLADPAPSAPSTATAIAEPKHEEQMSAALEVEEVRLREDEIAELILTDPAKYEELLDSGDLDEELVDEHE